MSDETVKRRRSRPVLQFTEKGERPAGCKDIRKANAEMEVTGLRDILSLILRSRENRLSIAQIVYETSYAVSIVRGMIELGIASQVIDPLPSYEFRVSNTGILWLRGEYWPEMLKSRMTK